MRFSIFDLVVFSITSSAISVPLMKFAPLSGLARSLLLLLGTVSGYLILTSIIYRMFHLYPLMLPRCPYCRAPDRHYRSISQNWPLEVVECAVCSKRIELCLISDHCNQFTSELLRFELLWPYSFGGRWKKVETLHLHD